MCKNSRYVTGNHVCIFDVIVHGSNPWLQKEKKCFQNYKIINEYPSGQFDGLEGFSFKNL